MYLYIRTYVYPCSNVDVMGVRNAFRSRFGDADTVMAWGERPRERESVMEYCVWKWMNFDCVYRVYARQEREQRERT